MKSIIFFLLVLIFGFQCTNNTGETHPKNNRKINSITYIELYKVIGIKDGDTYELLKDKQSLTVRTAHIDCPEKNQPFGQAAKHFASDHCFGKMVRLLHNNKYDRNHRLIAEVILPDGKNLNKLLVLKGLAWHYKKYSNSMEYAELENIARRHKVGIWSDPNAIQPEVWRN